MSKVILTKEQAEFVEKYKAVRGIAEKLSKAVREGYVIKSEFKLRDKVVNTYNNQFSTGEKILSIVSMESDEYSVGLSNGLYYVEDALRLATPEEIYWLENLGRDKVMDFWHGDMLLYKNMETRYLTESHDYDYAKEDYQAGLISGIYPSESFKSCPQEDK